MKFKSIFMIFIFLVGGVLCQPSDSISSKKRGVVTEIISVLEGLEGQVIAILEDLYSFVYSCDEWEASRFSTLGRTGDFINRNILRRVPEETARKFEFHKRECLKLIDEVVLVLPKLIAHKIELKKEFNDEQYKKSVKKTVVFIGKTISWVSGYKCPVFQSLKKQLAQYEVCLESLEADFIKKRLSAHGPTFMQLYGEKFMVAIFVAALVAGCTVASSEMRRRVNSAFRSANYLFFEGIKSFKIWFGWEKYKGDELVDNMDRTYTDNYESGINFVKAIIGSGKPIDNKKLSPREELREKISPIIKKLEKLAQEAPNPNVDPNLSKVDREVIRRKRESKRGEMEEHLFKLVDEVGKAVGRIPQNRLEMDEKLKIIWKQWWRPGKYYNLRNLGVERGKVEFNLTNLFIVQLKLGIARGYNSVKPFGKGIYDFMLLAKALVPVYFGYLGYKGFKKGAQVWSDSQYNSIDDAIFHVDRLLSKYTNNKYMTKLDQGRLIFWITKLRRNADSSALSRDDRRRIVALIEEIKNTELPVSQKLRAIDILWRSRKALPAVS